MRNAVRPGVLEQAAMTGMVKVSTTEKLIALADFFGSPVGKSAMGKFGAYMADVMPVIRQEMFRALQEQESVDRHLRASGPRRGGEASGGLVGGAQAIDLASDDQRDDRSDQQA